MTGAQKYGRILKGWLIAIILSVAGFGLRAQQPIPDQPEMIRVSVDHADNGVRIEWKASQDPGVDLYKLYREEGDAYRELFTFAKETLAYTHRTSGLKNLAYSVTAVDTLDGSTSRESLVGSNAHQAATTSLVFDPCDVSVTINWTEYKGWDNQISGYRVYGAPAGAEPQPLSFVNAGLRSFRDREVSFDTPYVYYVEAVNISGITSLSPVDTILTLFPEGPEYLRLDQVSVTGPKTVEVMFSAGTGGRADRFRLMRRNSPQAPFSEVTTLEGGQASYRVEDRIPLPDASYTYAVQAIYQPEGCTSPLVVTESNTGNNIWLQSAASDRLVTLEWTPYLGYVNGISGYLIQRRNGSGEFVDIASVGPETLQWSEPIETVINGYQPGELAYRVLAIGHPVDGGVTGASTSNTALVAVESEIRLPSAFTPGSNDMNREFKPLIDFAPRDYTLMVFDRTGRILFQTADPGQGWDGTAPGGRVMEGVYVYHLRYTDFTGISRNITGNVTVLYP